MIIEESGNKVCTNCHISGHTANVCCKDKIRKAEAFTIDLVQKSGNLHYVNGNVSNCDVNLLIDTGAAFSILSTNFIQSRGLSQKLLPCDLRGCVADGRELNIVKCIHDTLVIDGKSITATFYVMDFHKDGILGMDLLPRIGLQVGPVDGIICSLLPDVVHEHKEVFD